MTPTEELRVKETLGETEELQVKEAFGEIHVPDSVKKRALAAIERERKGRARGRLRAVSRMRVLAAAACFALVACIAGCAWTFVTPSACIDIDVNPSVELRVNRFDIVVGCDARNDDGRSAIDAVNCLWRPYADVAADLDGVMRSIAGEGSVVEVAIDCADDAQYEALANASGKHFGAGGETHCIRTSAEECAQAHEAGMGVAKFRMYRSLRDAGVDISQEECAASSMRELRDLAADHGVDSDDEHQGQGKERRNGEGREEGQRNAAGASQGHHGAGQGDGRRTRQNSGV